MVNNKADVSTTTIIMIAIGVFVLVLVIGFTTGFFGKLSGQIGAAGGGEIGTAKTNCNALCAQAKANVDSWKASTYCTQLQNVGDTDGDGSADYENCWDETIGVNCATKKAIGNKYTVYHVKGNACDVTPDVVATELMQYGL